MKRALIAIVLVSCLCITTSCVKISKKVINNCGLENNVFKLGIYDLGTYSDDINEIIEKVNLEANGSYKVEVIKYDLETFLNPSSAKIDYIPDFFWVPSETIPALVSLKVVDDISNELDTSFNLKRSLFYKNILNVTTIDNKIYGLPFEIEPTFIYYNKDSLTDSNIPYPTAIKNWTWDEFVLNVNNLSTIKRDDTLNSSYKQYGFAPASGVDLSTFVWAGGGDIISKSRKSSNINNLESLTGIEILSNLVRKSVIPNQEILAKYGTIENMFINGQISMIMSKYNPELESQIISLDENKRFELGVAPIPVSYDGKAYNNFSSVSMVLKAGCNENKLAYEAYEAITKALIKESLFSPLAINDDDSHQFMNFNKEFIDVYRYVLENTRSINYVPSWYEIDHLTDELYEKILKNNTFDYKQDTEILDKKINELLK